MKTNTDQNHALPFNTREEYLTFVKEWKINYKQLSQDIRQLKYDFKLITSCESKHDTEGEHYVAAKARMAEAFKAATYYSSYQAANYYYKRGKLKAEATLAIAERAEGKIQAAELREARLAEAAAVA